MLAITHLKYLTYRELWKRVKQLVSHFVMWDIQFPIESDNTWSIFSYYMCLQARLSKPRLNNPFSEIAAYQKQHMVFSFLYSWQPELIKQKLVPVLI